jgi:hypothetical protein
VAMHRYHLTVIFGDSVTQAALPLTCGTRFGGSLRLGR